jgi:putative RNA 2'-phosphotransferase
MTKKTSHSRTSLEKLLRYALGNQPDEFGLVLSDDGFVPVKELVTALKEEDGFRWLNETRVKELINLPLQSDY